MSRPSRSVRQIGWLLAANLALILFLIVFGLLLHAMKISVEGHPFLTDMFGQHGLFFNFLLPFAVLTLIPLSIIWVVAWVIARLRKPD
jgi:hypothetical protein